MRLLYLFFIRLYAFSAVLLAWFDPKVRKFAQGRKAQFASAPATYPGEWIWFHASSLGEFEQGKPIMLAARKAFPKLKLLVTFYSPSGYEVRKDDLLPDLVLYLPFDTPSKVSEFLDRFTLRAACFIKYDFWLNMLTGLHRRGIPIICVGGIFRKEQLFFKPYGAFYRRFLQYFDRILVQDDASKELLQSVGIRPVVVSGDPRFDRVWSIKQNPQKLEIVEQFKGHDRVMVFGSIWPSDWKIIRPVIPALLHRGLKLIFAPHEVSAHHLDPMVALMPEATFLWSKAGTIAHHQKKILVIDEMGHLSSIYAYASLAYIGGSFKGTLHNILEPAVFGIPLIFGKHPTNAKFREAVDLTSLGGASQVKNDQELICEVNLLLDDPHQCKEKGVINTDYVASQRGATEKTMEIISNIIADPK